MTGSTMSTLPRARAWRMYCSEVASSASRAANSSSLTMLADMFITIDDLPHPEPANGLGGGFVDDAQYGGEGVLGFQRLLLQIEFGVVLDRELIDQGLGFLEGRCPQAELDFSLRGIQVLDVQGNSGAKVIDITALVKPCLLCHATVLFRRRCTSPVYHSAFESRCLEPFYSRTTTYKRVGGVDGTRTRDPRRDRPVF